MEYKHLPLIVLVLAPALVVAQCPFAPKFKEIDREHDQESDKSESGEGLDCSKLLYRTYNGYCNNLKKPDRGTTNSYYARLLPAGEYRKESTLPTAANVSKELYIDIPITEKDYTLASMQYGQFIAHDISNRMMPANGIRQITKASSYLDLSPIYGNDKEAADSVRLFKGGLLKTETKHGQEFPESLKKPTVEDNCSDVRDPDGESCYVVGDNRSNQNPQLALIHIVWMREHNRIARVLSSLNPEWCDEKVFQEARKINIAQHQHIAFYQYLPIVLGKQKMIEKKIIYDADGYVDDYDEDVDATALDEHGTAAFRYYHTQIAGHLKLINDTQHSTGALRISDYIGRPQVIEKGNNFHLLTIGLTLQEAMGVDRYHDEEITKYMFKEGHEFGEDLKAIDIRRGREHLLAPYNAYRKLCGMKQAQEFSDFKDVIDPELVNSLNGLYHHPDDVDLTVGGSLETHVPGTWAGPTFHCILMKQFYNTRVGDRYWYEHSGELGFTLEQLKEIRRSSLAKIMCENAKLSKIQKNAFYLPDSEKNPVTDCEQLPSVNLNLWKETKSEA